MKNPFSASIALASFTALSMSAVSHAQSTVDNVRLDSALRFRNAPPVTAVRDPHLLAKPSERAFLRASYYYDAYVGQRSVRAMKDQPSGRALGVNALDEVPDSSWFENRIGARPMTPQELRLGPEAQPQPPFRVIGMKEGGTKVGVRVRDARGVAYLLKFGGNSAPEGEVSTDPVLQRLLWSVGYHTPEDFILDFRAGDLRLQPGAKMKDARGVARAMTDADLQHALALGGKRPDGSYHALLSRLLDGVPVGGYAQEGVRPDDPNDIIAHDDRRDVRGARVFFSWLNLVDVKEDNVLDTWIEDPATPGRGRIRHFLVDFGTGLGMCGWPDEQSAGFAEMADLGVGARSLVSFGLWKRPWEGMLPVDLPAVGNFEAARFDPVSWRPQYPWAPFERFDRFDGVWGARILMRLSPEHIATAVDEGHYSDPRSAAYVTRTLIERQRKIGRHYLAQTSPLEGFTVATDRDRGDARLCFDDPLLAHFGAGEPQLLASTRHRITTWGFDGRPLPTKIERAGQASLCVDGLSLAAEHGGYTIVDIQTRRAGTPDNRVLVHVARDPATGSPRVIGLRRL